MYKGELRGTYELTTNGTSAKFSFRVEGYVTGAPFGHLSVCEGSGNILRASGRLTSYETSGFLFNESGTNSIPLNLTVVTEGHNKKFIIKGRTGPGRGALAGTSQGTVEGFGELNHKGKGKLSLALTVNVP